MASTNSGEAEGSHEGSEPSEPPIQPEESQVSQQVASSAVASASNQLPLPNELTLQMFVDLPEYLLPYLWCNFRHVCKSWKQFVEEAFIKRHLATITIDLAFSDLRFEPALTFAFDRISETNNECAFFRLVHDEMSDFTDMTAEIRRTEFHPFKKIFYHQVTMANVATGDPGLECLLVYPREISFLWKPMLNQLLGEEIRLRRLAYRLIQPKLLPTNDSMTNKMHFYLIQRTDEFYDEAEKVREQRLRRQYERSGVQWQSIKTHESMYEGSEKLRKFRLTRKHFKNPERYMEV
ncbi:hypothetical protein F4819DRAFT_487326 [Hypoxylon fuscum]|nr:hypothetical protein F4819DRAFT_487326 [Hypoxylon fuscum]